MSCDVNSTLEGMVTCYILLSLLVNAYYVVMRKKCPGLKKKKVIIDWLILKFLFFAGVSVWKWEKYPLKSQN